MLTPADPGRVAGVYGETPPRLPLRSPDEADPLGFPAVTNMSMAPMINDPAARANPAVR